MLNRLGVLRQGAKGYYSRLGQHKVQLQGLWWWWWQRSPSSGARFTSVPFHVFSQVVRAHEATCTYTAAKLLLTSMCTLVTGQLIGT